MARVIDPARPSWDVRFAAFERSFSIVYPVSSASVQSADTRAVTGRPADSPEAPPARPH